MSDIRKITRLVVDGAEENWEEVSFQKLKKGDTFRMFDPPEWTAVEWNGEREFYATSDPYLYTFPEDGVEGEPRWTIRSIKASEREQLEEEYDKV